MCSTNYLLMLLVFLLPLLVDSRVLGNIKRQAEPIEDERTASYWLNQAQQQLATRLERIQLANGNGDTRMAKNIIMLMGDGMSITTMTAARILKGQQAGHSGEESQLAVEQFPYTGLSKTYCTDSQTADSACAATACLTGVKTNCGSIGQSAQGASVESIVQWAQRAGKATGIVTTTRLTDASPAAAYAHVKKRTQELDIGRQLIEDAPGRHLDVILGGGLGKFASERTDGRDLLQQWHDANPQGCFARTLAELRNCSIDPEAGRLLGIFSDSHMAYNLAASQEQPRLCDMTAAAIEHLAAQQATNGFFVFIEGGRIDHGHHETRAGYALDEMLEFDAAIETALRLTNVQETLIVVTADHSHTLSMAGYASRGTSILGMDQSQRDLDGVPYSTLNYAIGKWQSLNKAGKRENPAPHLSRTSFTPSYIHAKGVHSGEDVAVFARGPQSQLFSGVMEQNLLPHLMAYAACLGHGDTLCKHQQKEHTFAPR
ncbi:alkaline phosphatase, tissue-nonspecific isozyme [Drosophila sulfurigaster albostrigata]|uniref:alkaline phosphatase, tissue-nonspecific isozyme n=1 Tax=Drosophila sulfurigaster albostrigata TaxID=89887 RepID=UPI002D21E16E|nr:alkaline phosphatase, tissue-nonspecific isozyme [Drosophila sulfurigaster albostrigata]